MLLGVLVLLSMSLTSAKGPKKKKSGDGSESGMVTCMTSYLGLYNSTVQDDNSYYGLDYNQVSMTSTRPPPSRHVD